MATTGSYFQPQLPTSSVTTPSQTYAPSYNMNSPFGQILQKLGGNLQTQNPWTQANPYEAVASPYQEMARQYTESTIRPWFEQYQLNPFVQQQGNQMAAGMGQMYGQAAPQYENSLNQLYSQQFYPQVQSVQEMADQWAREVYDNMLNEAYNSPTAFNNIGAQPTSNLPYKVM